MPTRSAVPASWPKAKSAAVASLIVAVAMAASWPVTGRAQERGTEVVGCDSLVALRLRNATATSGGPKPPLGQPGCRQIPRADFGDVRQRAMIGGTPFECLALRGSESCAWVSP